VEKNTPAGAELVPRLCANVRTGNLHLDFAFQEFDSRTVSHKANIECSSACDNLGPVRSNDEWMTGAFLNNEAGAPLLQMYAAFLPPVTNSKPASGIQRQPRSVGKPDGPDLAYGRGEYLSPIRGFGSRPKQQQAGDENGPKGYGGEHVAHRARLGAAVRKTAAKTPKACLGKKAIAARPIGGYPVVGHLARWI
jgi:hypothetical protein